MTGINEMLDTLLKLKKLGGGGDGELEELKRENLLLRNMGLRRSLAEPSAAQRDILRLRVEERHRQTKSVLDMFSKLAMDKNISPESREHISKLMESYTGMLGDGERAAAEMVLRYSPVNPMAQKAKRFTEVFGGPPKVPEVDLENPASVRNHLDGLFKVRDYERFRAMVVTGKDPGPVRELINVGSYYAKRSKDGYLRIWNEEDETLKEIAKGYKTTVAALIEGGGMVKEGEPRAVEFLGEQYLVQPMRKVWDEDEDGNIIPVDPEKALTYRYVGETKRDEKGREVWAPTPVGRKKEKEIYPKRPPLLDQLFRSVIGKDTSGKTEGSKMYKSLSGILETLGPEAVNQRLEELTSGSGWKIRFFVPKDEEEYKNSVRGIVNWLLETISGGLVGPLFDNYSLEFEDGYLRAWPAVETISVTDKYGVSGLLDGDGRGHYWSKNGIPLGTRENVERLLQEGMIDFGGKKK